VIFLRLRHSRTMLGVGVLGTIFLLNTFDMFFLFSPIHVALWLVIVAHPQVVVEQT
jgi:hypothetical protein